MHIAKSLNNLMENQTCLRIFKRMVLLNFIEKLSSWAKFHHNVDIEGVFENVVKLYKVRMVQMRHHLSFFENSTLLMCGIFFFVYDFDGTKLFGREMLNFFNFSERSWTKNTLDRVLFLDVSIF